MSNTYVDFKKNIAGQKVKGRGIPVGEHLIVSYAPDSIHFAIYQAHDGKMFINTEFNNMDDCVGVAQWFDNNYRDYFCIWSEYPNANIITLVQWADRNSMTMREFVDLISRKRADKAFLAWAWNVAQDKYKEWVRQ